MNKFQSNIIASSKFQCPRQSCALGLGQRHTLCSSLPLKILSFNSRPLLCSLPCICTFTVQHADFTCSTQLTVLPLSALTISSSQYDVEWRVLGISRESGVASLGPAQVVIDRQWPAFLASPGRTWCWGQRWVSDHCGAGHLHASHSQHSQKWMSVYSGLVQLLPSCHLYKQSVSRKQ